MNRRLGVLVMGLALAALFGLSGCKNVCAKAADHMKSCCEGQDTPVCSGINSAAEGQEAVGECNDAAKTMAETMLNASCESIRDGSFMTAGAGGGSTHH